MPSSGFYEWDHRQTSKRDKYFFSLSGQVVYMAGIYSSFASLDGSLTECFVILTCPAADSIAELHDRMPVILAQIRDPDLAQPSDRQRAAAELACTAIGRHSHHAAVFNLSRFSRQPAAQIARADQPQTRNIVI